MASNEENTTVRRQGRPEVSIGEDQLRYLVEESFRVKDISDMFECSTKTIERRMMQYGITLHNYTPLSDSELDTIVMEITSLFPRCGEKTVSGIVIQHERVRESPHRVDPSDVRTRCRTVLHCQTY